MASECVFCRIVEGEEPAEIVARFPDALAFRPLNPVTARHTLVIPKIHVENFVQEPLVTAVVMHRAAQVAGDLGMTPANLITSAGREETQSVFHLHVHIVPRRADDGLALPWWSGRRPTHERLGT